MIEYSPFDKQLKEVRAEDLEVLTRAHEGWYIEYKQEVSKPRDIAKSVSAFANTQGGWLFYGIEEKSKAEPVAGRFPGIERADAESMWQRIQQAIPGNTTPPPYFDTKVVWGPCDAIGLAAERGIICIHVPLSLAAPHVHRDGRIYRRVGDQSDPKFENDRFLLDQLWRRADTFKQGYKEWIARDQEFAEAEQERPYVRLLIVPASGETAPYGRIYLLQMCEKLWEQLRFRSDRSPSTPSTPQQRGLSLDSVQAMIQTTLH